MQHTQLGVVHFCTHFVDRSLPTCVSHLPTQHEQLCGQSRLGPQAAEILTRGVPLKAECDDRSVRNCTTPTHSPEPARLLPDANTLHPPPPPPRSSLVHTRPHNPFRLPTQSAPIATPAKRAAAPQPVAMRPPGPGRERQQSASPRHAFFITSSYASLATTLLLPSCQTSRLSSGTGPCGGC